MGRPIKNGLDYFPVDTDIFEDDKLKRIFNDHGLVGEAIAIRLLCKIYRNGAWLLWNNDISETLLYKVRAKVRPNKLRQIVDDLVTIGFFDQKIFQTFQVLTSNGIQRRYINICRQLHRQIIIPEDYLINSEETDSRLGVLSEDKYTKEKKRKEIKLNEIKRPAEDRPPDNSKFKENGIEDWEEAGRRLYRDVYGNK